MSLVLGVDPGKTTGWAVACPTDEGRGVRAIGHGYFSLQLQLEYNQLELDAFLRHAERMLSVLDLTAIACEDYVITPGTIKKSRGERAWSLEGIGVLRYLAAKANVPFVLQKPAAVKPLVTDHQLRRLGLWLPGKDHARDGMRHAVYHLAKKGQVKLSL